MIARFTITLEGNYIKVLSTGDKNFEYSQRLWQAVVEACREHDCFKILGISESTSPMPVLDGYRHADLFRKLGIGRKYKIAWVELNEDAKDATYFIDTVLFNRGLPGRLFDTVLEATEWLLAVDDN